MKQNVANMKRVIRTIALLGMVALLSFAASAPVQAASPAPSPSASPTPKASPKPKAAVVAGTPTPLPANAPKPGIKPKVTSKLINKKAAVAVSAPSASLPAPNCSPACDLWALGGSISLAGGPVGGLPVWGFSTAGAAGPALVPGPVLIATVNDSVRITLHNQLPNPPGPIGTECPDEANCLSLEMPAASGNGAPDQTGIAPGGTHTYQFGKLGAGTYIYQAGPTPHAQRQIRMGLAGILIVRPADFATSTTPSAYGAGNGAFNAESTALLNEFDAEFNANPFEFDPLDYKANLFLLNGLTFDNNPLHQPFPGRIPVGPGDNLLLHYANLGTHDRGMTILNERQNVLGQDGRNVFDLTPGTTARLNPSNVATVWMTPGQVTDAFVSIDPQAPLGTQLPIFESGYHLNNLESLGLGGALSYLDVVSGVGGAPSGPIATVALAAPTHAGNSPDYTGTEDLKFTATLTSTSGNLTAGEWFLDTLGATATGDLSACAATPSAWAGLVTSATFVCTIPAVQLDNLVLASAPVDGDHIIWAHGQDAGGWGVVSGDVFTYNVSGPDTGALSTHSSPTNEALRFTDVANGACTGVDKTTGCTGAGADKPVHDMVVLGTSAASLSNWVVLGGEYCILAASVALTSANCPSGSGSGLVFTTPGPASGAPGAVDACTPQLQPGAAPVTPGPAPAGGSLVSFCADVAPATLAALPPGTYNLYVHAYEAPNQAGTGLFGAVLGRWGSYSLPDAKTAFVVDRTGPAAGTVSFDRNPNNGTLNSVGNLNFLDSVQVGATLDDTGLGLGGSNIALAEVFLSLPTVTTNPVPAAQYGTGAEMIPGGAKWDSPVKKAFAYIPLAELTSYPEGKVRFWAHGLDIAGNWGAWGYGDLTLDRTAPKFNYPSTPADGSSIACQTLAGCSIKIDASDPISGGVNSNIVQAEWFVDPGAHLICEQPPFPGCTPEVVAPGDPGKGFGTQVPVGGAASTTLNVQFNPLAQPAGTKIVFRVKDAAGNWSLDSMVLTT
jgi:hypothetical protein